MLAVVAGGRRSPPCDPQELAEELYGDALAVFRRVLGAEHPDTLRAMRNLSAVYRGLGRDDEAEHLLDEAAVLEASRGDLNASGSSSPSRDDDKSATDGFSEWMPGPEYQKLFQTMSQRGFYPCVIEEKAGPSFRAKFVHKPNADFRFFSFHGISRIEYDRRTSDFRQKELRELNVTSFTDADGNLRYSGTWIHASDVEAAQAESLIQSNDTKEE